MPYRFNFTGRRTLHQSDFRLEVSELLTPLNITLSLTSDVLDGFSGVSGARLVVEAYRHNEAQRRDLGPVARFKSGSPVVFDRFSDGAHVLFRIKVVDPATRRLLALAPRIRPFGAKDRDGRREKMLPVQFAGENDRMGGQIWSIRFELEHPTLLLDRSRAGFDYVNDPKFRLLALPRILRDILLYAFVLHAGRRPKWAPSWQRFVEDRLGVDGCPDDENLSGSALDDYMDDAAKWIEEAVAVFSEQNKLGAIAR